MLDWSDAVKVGDVDPTTILRDMDYDCCPATDGRWSCTREGKHRGNHIAGDGFTVGAVFA